MLKNMRTFLAEKSKKAYRVDLSALMAVCETNYWRLRKLLLPLFPELENNTKFHFSIPASGETALVKNAERYICLHIIERCPYTTTLEFSEIKDDGTSANLSHKSTLEKQCGLSPQLTVRIYHDAKTAEVISFQQQKNFFGRYEYPNAQMRQQDEKFQLNNLLAEWLHHCLHYGYKLQTDNTADIDKDMMIHASLYSRLQ